MYMSMNMCIFSLNSNEYDIVIRKLIWSQQSKPDIKLFSLINVQIM